MKRLRYRVLGSVLLSVLLISACDEEFLDLNPLDEVSSGVYFAHAADLEMYANQFYPEGFTEIPDWPGKNNGDLSNGWSMAIFGEDDNSDNEIKIGEADTRLAGQVTLPISQDDSDWDFSTIRAANYGIVNYSINMEDTPDKYNQFLGELYFFRAHAYFILLKKYGDVIWVDKPLNQESEELYSERTSRTEIAKYILSDLDTAAVLMNSGRYLDGTRVSKEVALTYKSRVALYEGTWEKYHHGNLFEGTTDGTDFLQQSVEAAEAVMTSNLYSIYNNGKPNNDYYDLFRKTDYASIDEVIFWKKYSVDLDFVNVRMNWLSSPHEFGPTRELAAAYLCKDNGLPRSVSPDFNEDLCDIIAKYEASKLDPRFFQTFASPSAPWIVLSGKDTAFWFNPAGDVHFMFNNATPSLIQLPGYSGPPIEEGELYPPGSYAFSAHNITPTGYARRKGYDYDVSKWAPNQAYIAEEYGTMFMRYAEILLNYAEAKAELKNINQGDLDKSINILRERVGMPHLTMDIATDPNWNFPDLAPIINEIRRERRVELAFEGFRFDDLMRWAAADEIIIDKRFKGVYYPDGSNEIHIDENNYVDALQEVIPGGYKFNPERDYLLPLPTSELALNPNLEQNPGW